MAFDTPFKWTRQVASDFGGTKVGMVIHWSGGISAKGEQRDQVHHVIDVAPAIRDANGPPEPTLANGGPQRPADGTRMSHLFEDADTEERRATRYFEISGNRAIYHERWWVRKIHKAPWERKPRHALDEDIGEFYDTTKGFRLTNELAQGNPEKLRRFARRFPRQGRAQQNAPSR